MRTSLVVIMAIGLSSCRAILDIKTNFKPHDYEIVQLKPQVYKPGDRVPIKGEFFFNQMHVVIAGVEYPVEYPKDSEAELGYETDVSFILPTDVVLLTAAGTKSGKLPADMKRNDRVVPLNHIYLAEEKDFPLNTGGVDKICDSEQFYNAKGVLSRGTKNCIALKERVACTEDGQIDCVAKSSFKAAKSASLNAANIKSGVTIAGVAGSVIPAPANCAAPAAQNCVATGIYFAGTACSTNNTLGCVTAGSYKSADWTNLTAANIKNGAAVAGLTGTYPSSSNLLSGASATADLDLATFDTKIKNASTFEWFGPDGLKYSASGDADISAANILLGITVFGMAGTFNGVASCMTAVQATCQADSACTWNGSVCSVNTWNIRYGVSLNGSVGALKTNCKNRMNSSLFNSDSTPPGNAATTAGTVNDWWDTIDDNNNYLGFPTTLVSAFTAETDCSYVDWQDLTADGSCDSAADDCMMKDRITGLIWSESYPVTGSAPAVTYANWSAAVNKCDVLVYGGRSDWRLPTLKELELAYVHGIRSVSYHGTGTIRGTGSTDNNSAFMSIIQGNAYGQYWSSSSRSDQSGGWTLSLYDAFADLNNKTNTYNLVCVAP